MHPPFHSRIARGFTLVELLVVVAIVSALAALLVPALGTISNGGGMSSAVTGISGLLEQARAYSMGNNTYVYVGIQEVNAISSNSVPAASGTGQLVIAVVASQNGTRPYTTLATTPITPSLVNPGIGMIDKIHSFAGVHLVSPSAAMNGPNMTGRPTATSASVVDISKATATTTFQWPFTGAPNYSFNKVIEFDPQGVARVQQGSAYSASVSDYLEITLVATHGNAAVATAADQAAIQVDGITGAVRFYRP